MNTEDRQILKAAAHTGDAAYREDKTLETSQSHEQRWRHWQHAAVRDMAWVLASAPLLAPAQQGKNTIRWLDTAWADRVYLTSEKWLAALDLDPTPLLHALAQDNDHRLGSYFESLLAFWLSWPANPLYRLIAHGLAIRSDSRTLGELDFLVQDRHSGEIQHWEVAVKFYLGIRAGRAMKNWIGPGMRDRLDLKVRHLLDHQLPLASTPVAAQLIHEMGLAAPVPVCLLKGRLFYPPDADRKTWAPTSASPDHPSGWWMPQADFLEQYGSSTLRWIRLPKENWMTPVQADATASQLYKSTKKPPVTISDALNAHDFIESLQQSPDNRAIAVIGLLPDTTHGEQAYSTNAHALDKLNHQEATRGFICPPLWPNS